MTGDNSEVDGGGSASSLRVTGGRLLGPEGFAPGELTTSGDRISSVTPAAAGVSGPIPLGATVLDATDLFVAPGFIDLQINGGFGHDLASVPLSMWEVADKLPAYGVTSFLPTIITGLEVVRSAAIRALARRPADHRGAEPLGLHFEGPMLNVEHRGVHPERQICAPSTEIIDDWRRDNGVALVTLAPELADAIDVIRVLRARGVVVAAGHTGADAEQARQAARAGLTMVTHLFNAMKPFHHRDPGLVGYALADSDLVATIIADGKHLDPVSVALAWRAKGPDNLLLVSDAVAGLGVPPGTYDLGRVRITSDGTTAYDHDNRLAGSALGLDASVRNLMTFAGCDLAAAVRTVTTNPARLLGDDERGVLRPGARADLVVLDSEGRVVATVCGGRVVHIADGVLSRLPPPN